MIEVQDFHKAFARQVAVQGISFRVEPGQLLAIIGPNGAGKTTTMRALAGIIPASRGRWEGIGNGVRHRAAVSSRTPPRVRRGGRRRCRHHDRGLSALGRPRYRRQGGDSAIRAARRQAGRRALGFASTRRRRLDAECAPGRPVREDGQAQGLSRTRDLRCGSAPGRHEDE